jgi:hypothetical protein
MDKRIRISTGISSHEGAQLHAAGARLARDWAALVRWAYGDKALLLDHPVNHLSREVWQYCIAGLWPGDLR